MNTEWLTLYLCFVSQKLIQEEKKNEKRIQISADNTVNDLRYEIKFENRVKDKINFFIKRNISFLF